MRSTSFHLAMRSLRANEPTLSWPVRQPIARCTIVTSSVSPERGQDCSPAGGARRLYGSERLGHGAHLVWFDQGGVAGARASGIADTIGAGDEKVVANDLDAISNRSGETGQAGLIIFRKRVLYRADRIAVEPANQHRGHRIGIEHAVFECKMIAAVSIEIRRGNVERDHNLLSRLTTRTPPALQELKRGAQTTLLLWNAHYGS